MFFLLFTPANAPFRQRFIFLSVYVLTYIFSIRVTAFRVFLSHNFCHIIFAVAFYFYFVKKKTGQHLLPPSSFYLKFSFFNNLIFHFSFTVTSMIDYQIRQLIFLCVISPFLKYCLSPLIHQYTITSKHIRNTINCMDSGAQCSALLNKYVSIRC